MRAPRFQCGWCGRLTADAPGQLCRVCDELVPCEQHGGIRSAPPSIGVCERCRRRNKQEQRALLEAARVVASLDLAELPDRVPLVPAVATPGELRELAVAARALAEAMRRMQLRAANVIELRPRRQPSRAAARRKGTA